MPDLEAPRRTAICTEEGIRPASGTTKWVRGFRDTYVYLPHYMSMIEEWDDMLDGFVSSGHVGNRNLNKVGGTASPYKRGVGRVETQKDLEYFLLLGPKYAPPRALSVGMLTFKRIASTLRIAAASRPSLHGLASKYIRLLGLLANVASRLTGHYFSKDNMQLRNIKKLSGFPGVIPAYRAFTESLDATILKIMRQQLIAGRLRRDFLISDAHARLRRYYLDFTDNRADLASTLRYAYASTGYYFH